MFNKADVILGGKLIFSATNRGVLEVLLNFDKEAAESQLGCGLFYKDMAGQMEEMDISADPVLNTGPVSGQKRARWSSYRVTLYNVCSVHWGMFSTSGGVHYIGRIP